MQIGVKSTHPDVEPELAGERLVEVLRREEPPVAHHGVGIDVLAWSQGPPVTQSAKIIKKESIPNTFPQV